MMLTDSLQIALPEILLSVFAMVALLVTVYTGKDKFAPRLLWLTAGVFVILAAWLGYRYNLTYTAFGGAFVDDDFARYAKITILLSAAAVLVMGETYLFERDLLRFEYPILIALAVVGMMVMVSAGGLMTLYMGLELQSLSLYVVAALRRDGVRSTEAGLKYFILGALSSGLLLYGASLTYGFAGTTLFTGISTATDGGVSLGLLFGLVFVMTGLAFKVSAAPFHMWTPDVYEGSSAPVTAFFATAPKVAAMALFARVVFDAFGGVVGDWQQIIAFLSVLSMFIGAIAAIGQTNIKRLMAYSSIAHMGFALMGLAAGTEAGVAAMMLYMAIYVTMNIGAFAFIMSMEREGQAVTAIDALQGYWRHNSAKALAMLVLVASLAGIPGTIGFFGKLAVLRAAVEANMVWLAVAGVIASVIALFYYLRIIYYMYFGEDHEDPLDTRTAPVVWVILMGAGVIMVAGIINLFGVDTLATGAAFSLVK